MNKGFDLVVTKLTKLQIVIPNNATSPERFATEECAKYLQKSAV